MNTFNEQVINLVGYGWIAENLGIKSPFKKDQYIRLFFDLNQFRREKETDKYVKCYTGEITKEQYENMTLMHHIIFAVKRELFNPYILKKAFSSVSEKDRKILENKLNNTPLSASLRKTAYLYELFTGKEINYEGTEKLRKERRPAVRLLNPATYYTLSDMNKIIEEHSPKYSDKYRVFDNTLGDLRIIAPTIQKTRSLEKCEQSHYGAKMYEAFIGQRCELSELVREKMYIKESKMTFAIEDDSKDRNRINAYLAMLKNNKYGIPELNKTSVLEMQKTILPSEDYTGEYRKIQNFIGHSSRLDRACTVDYITPSPNSVNELMNGIFKMHKYLSNDSIDPIIAGTALHLAFTAVHPLSDGNGRISRTLIHDQIAKHNYLPCSGVIFPMSDIIAKTKNEYEKALDDVTGGIIKNCSYEFTDDGMLNVTGNDTDYYRYLDATDFAEYMYQSIENTVEHTVIGIIKEAEFRYEASLEIDKFYPLSDKEKKFFLKSVVAENGLISNNLTKKILKFVPPAQFEKMKVIIAEKYQNVFNTNSFPEQDREDNFVEIEP